MTVAGIDEYTADPVTRVRMYMEDEERRRKLRDLYRKYNAKYWHGRLPRVRLLLCPARWMSLEQQPEVVKMMRSADGITGRTKEGTPLIISIRPTLPFEERRRVLLHEMAHIAAGEGFEFGTDDHTRAHSRPWLEEMLHLKDAEPWVADHIRPYVERFLFGALTLGR
jgi:hypothetical protein